MKKILSFFRSMQLGIILLILVMLCSLAGSLIGQGNTVAFYAETFKSFHGVILLLGLNDIFNSWYFILIVVLLCVNLTLCSLTRIRGVVRQKKQELTVVEQLPVSVRLCPEGLKKLREYLRRTHCKEEKLESFSVFHKNSLGRYGTFITHLAILLTVIFGAAALYLPKTTDKTCLPGDSIAMEDGTQITVDSFSILDAEGKLDYASVLRVVLPSGQNSEPTRISVNHPMSFGNYKIYQQTYGTAGSITVRNTSTNGEDVFTLTEQAFLSLDAVNGLWYEAIYPGYLRDADGNYTLITSTSGRYDDPVYQVLVATEGEYTPVLAFPGETLTVGDLEYTFNNPVEYPGLRIKYTPPAVNALLILSFVLMITGLYITFFHAPVLVKVDSDGYAVSGAKKEEVLTELRLRFNEYERENKC